MVEFLLVVWMFKFGFLDDWGEGWVEKCWLLLFEILNGDGFLFGGYLIVFVD